MSNVEAVEMEIAAVGAQDSALAQTALSVARRLDDPRTSATSVSMLGKTMIDVLRELRSLHPPKPEEDEIERARQRRADRMAGKPEAGSSSSS